MSVAKNILAVILGILFLIFVVLLARWAGDKIKERFTTPKTVVVTNTSAPVVVVEPPPTATYSAAISNIPKTGPVEIFYVFSGLAAVSGIALRKIEA